MRHSDIFIVSILLLAVTFLTCCESKQLDSDRDASISNAPSVTAGYEKLSPVSVVLKGKANLGSTASLDLTLGFQYKRDDEPLAPVTKINATAHDEDYNYSVALTRLKPGVKYSFRSFVTQNGQDSFGETMTFTAKELSTMLKTMDASEVNQKTARLNAKLDLADVQYRSIEYGFIYGKSETATGYYEKGEPVAENAYSATLSTLSPGTQYWYKAYQNVDDQIFYGDVKTFTTLWNPVTEVTLDKAKYVFHTIGASLTLVPTVSPSDASDKSVSWKSSDDDVATVGQNGKVTAVGNGTATITVTTKELSKTATCAITVAQWVTGITLNKTSLVMAEGKSETLTATITPTNANDKSLTWTSSNTSVATVDQTGKVTAVSKGTAMITATAKDGSGVIATSSIKVCGFPEVVDLGIVVNGKTIKWASLNFGASSAEEYGEYYAWGETEPKPKSNYSWSSYEWSYGSYNFLTKYNNSSIYGSSTVDNKTVLEADDDVAHVKLGGNWRMPTDAEWTELMNNCTWAWTTLNGIKGYRVTGKKSGYTNKSIFLPAAGEWGDTYSNFVGSNGYYWSSSLYSDDPRYAYYVDFYSSHVGRSSEVRRYGLSVRPVSE